MGITEWIDPSPEEYLRLAVQSARVEARLVALHKLLRERLRQSSLMDEEQCVQDLENACRRMWRDWSGGILA